MRFTDLFANDSGTVVVAGNQLPQQLLAKFATLLRISKRMDNVQL